MHRAHLAHAPQTNLAALGDPRKWGHPINADLRFAFVPHPKGVMYELVNGVLGASTGGGTVESGGTPYGPSILHAADQQAFPSLVTWMPTVRPFTVFARLIKRQSDTAIQSLFGNAGWTFQMSYGSNNIGMTLWGVEDVPSSLPSPPADVPLSVGVVMPPTGQPLRFFQNGVTQTPGTTNGPNTNNTTVVLGANTGSGAPLRLTNILVLYCWARALSDGELMRLYEDPYLPIRHPARRSYLGAGASSLARTFVPSFF